MRKGVISTMCFVYIRVCRENSETKDGAEPRTGPEGAVKPTAGRLYEQKAFKFVFVEKMCLSLRLVFFETVLIGCVNQNENVLNK